MKDAKELVDLVLNAHGGRKRWDLLNTVTIQVSIQGITWPRKGYPDSLNDIKFKANLHAPFDTWSPMFAPIRKPHLTVQMWLSLKIPGKWWKKWKMPGILLMAMSY